MTLIGDTMMWEQPGPKLLVRDVALAEEAGFGLAVVRSKSRRKPAVSAIVSSVIVRRPGCRSPRHPGVPVISATAGGGRCQGARRA